MTKEIHELESTTIAITSNLMGDGDEELGKILMKNFIYTIKENQFYPSTIVLYNKAVYLSSENSQVIKDLKELEEKGVEILSCGTCLDYYGLKDKLQVGTITNMYKIYEKMAKSKKIINI